MATRKKKTTKIPTFPEPPTGWQPQPGVPLKVYWERGLSWGRDGWVRDAQGEKVALWYFQVPTENPGGKDNSWSGSLRPMKDWDTTSSIGEPCRSRIVSVEHLFDGETVARELDAAHREYDLEVALEKRATKALLPLFDPKLRRECDVYKNLSLWVHAPDVELEECGWTRLQFSRPHPSHRQQDRSIFFSQAEIDQEMPDMEVTKNTSTRELDEMRRSRYVTPGDLTLEQVAAVQFLAREKKTWDKMMRLSRCRDVLIAAARHSLPENLGEIDHGIITVTVGGSWHVTFAAQTPVTGMPSSWILATEPTKSAPMSLAL